jgi:hypothetical protein
LQDLRANLLLADNQPGYRTSLIITLKYFIVKEFLKNINKTGKKDKIFSKIFEKENRSKSLSKTNHVLEQAQLTKKV